MRKSPSLSVLNIRNDPNDWIVLSNEILHDITRIEKILKKCNKARYQAEFPPLMTKIQKLFKLANIELNTSPLLEHLELRYKQRDFIRNFIKLVIACRTLTNHWEATTIHESALLVCREVRVSLRELIQTRKSIERSALTKTGPKSRGSLSNFSHYLTISRQLSNVSSMNSVLDEKYALPKPPSLSSSLLKSHRFSSSINQFSIASRSLVQDSIKPPAINTEGIIPDIKFDQSFEASQANSIAKKDSQHSSLKEADLEAQFSEDSINSEEEFISKNPAMNFIDTDSDSGSSNQCSFNKSKSSKKPSVKKTDSFVLGDSGSNSSKSSLALADNLSDSEKKPECLNSVTNNQPSIAQNNPPSSSNSSFQSQVDSTKPAVMENGGFVCFPESKSSTVSQSNLVQELPYNDSVVESDPSISPARSHDSSASKTYFRANPQSLKALVSHSSTHSPSSSGFLTKPTSPRLSIQPEIMSRTPSEHSQSNASPPKPALIYHPSRSSLKSQVSVVKLNDSHSKVIGMEQIDGKNHTQIDNAKDLDITLFSNKSMNDYISEGLDEHMEKSSSSGSLSLETLSNSVSNKSNKQMLYDQTDLIDSPVANESGFVTSKSVAADGNSGPDSLRSLVLPPPPSIFQFYEEDFIESRSFALYNGSANNIDSAIDQDCISITNKTSLQPKKPKGTRPYTTNLSQNSFQCNGEDNESLTLLSNQSSRISLPVLSKRASALSLAISEHEPEGEAKILSRASSGLFRRRNLGMDVSYEDDEEMIKAELDEINEAKSRSLMTGRPVESKPISVRDPIMCRKILANLIDSYSNQPVDYMEGLFMIALDTFSTKAEFVDILEEMVCSLSTLFAILDSLGVQDYKQTIIINDTSLQFDLNREFTLRKDTIYSDIDDIINLADQFTVEDNADLRQGLTIVLISIIKEYEELLLVSKCILSDPGFASMFAESIDQFQLVRKSELPTEVLHLQETIRDLMSINLLRREQEEQALNPEKAAQNLKKILEEMEQVNNQDELVFDEDEVVETDLKVEFKQQTMLSPKSGEFSPYSTMSSNSSLNCRPVSLFSVKDNPLATSPNKSTIFPRTLDNEYSSHPSSFVNLLLNPSMQRKPSVASLIAPVAARVLFEGSFSGTSTYPILAKNHRSNCPLRQSSLSQSVVTVSRVSSEEPFHRNYNNSLSEHFAEKSDNVSISEAYSLQTIDNSLNSTLTKESDDQILYNRNIQFDSSPSSAQLAGQCSDELKSMGSDSLAFGVPLSRDDSFSTALNSESPSKCIDTISLPLHNESISCFDGASTHYLSSNSSQDTDFKSYYNYEQAPESETESPNSLSVGFRTLSNNSQALTEPLSPNGYQDTVSKRQLSSVTNSSYRLSHSPEYPFYRSQGLKVKSCTPLSVYCDLSDKSQDLRSHSSDSSKTNFNSVYSNPQVSEFQFHSAFGSTTNLSIVGNTFCLGSQSMTNLNSESIINLPTSQELPSNLDTESIIDSPISHELPIFSISGLNPAIYSRSMGSSNPNLLLAPHYKQASDVIPILIQEQEISPYESLIYNIKSDFGQQYSTEIDSGLKVRSDSTLSQTAEHGSVSDTSSLNFQPGFNELTDHSTVSPIDSISIKSPSDSIVNQPINDSKPIVQPISKSRVFRPGNQISHVSKKSSFNDLDTDIELEQELVDDSISYKTISSVSSESSHADDFQPKYTQVNISTLSKNDHNQSNDEEPSAYYTSKTHNSSIIPFYSNSEQLDAKSCKSDPIFSDEDLDDEFNSFNSEDQSKKLDLANLSRSYLSSQKLAAVDEEHGLTNSSNDCLEANGEASNIINFDQSDISEPRITASPNSTLSKEPFSQSESNSASTMENSLDGLLQEISPVLLVESSSSQTDQSQQSVRVPSHISPNQSNLSFSSFKTPKISTTPVRPFNKMTEEVMEPTKEYKQVKPSASQKNKTQILAWAISPLGDDLGFIVTDITRDDNTIPTRAASFNIPVRSKSFAGRGMNQLRPKSFTNSDPNYYLKSKQAMEDFKRGTIFNTSKGILSSRSSKTILQTSQDIIVEGTVDTPELLSQDENDTSQSLTVETKSSSRNQSAAGPECDPNDSSYAKNRYDRSKKPSQFNKVPSSLHLDCTESPDDHSYDYVSDIQVDSKLLAKLNTISSVNQSDDEDTNSVSIAKKLDQDELSIDSGLGDDIDLSLKPEPSESLNRDDATPTDSDSSDIVVSQPPSNSKDISENNFVINPKRISVARLMDHDDLAFLDEMSFAPPKGQYSVPHSIHDSINSDNDNIDSSDPEDYSFNESVSSTYNNMEYSSINESISSKDVISGNYIQMGVSLGENSLDAIDLGIDAYSRAVTPKPCSLHSIISHQSKGSENRSTRDKLSYHEEPISNDDSEVSVPSANKPRISKLALEGSDAEMASKVHATLTEGDVKTKKSIEKSQSMSTIGEPNGTVSDTELTHRPTTGKSPARALSSRKMGRFRRLLTVAKIKAKTKSSLLTFVAPHGVEFQANQPIPLNPYYIGRASEKEKDASKRRVNRSGSSASTFSNKSQSEMSTGSRKSSTMESNTTGSSRKESAEPSPSQSRKNSVPGSSSPGKASPNISRKNSATSIITPDSTNQTKGKRMSRTSTASGEVVKWFLCYEYTEADILMKDGLILDATLEALVERLTLHDEAIDSKFMETFLLTFRSFTNASEFLELLINRYTLKPPENLEPDDMAIWVSHKQTAVRIRVNNILKTWLESYFYESDDGICLKRLIEFCSGVMMDTMPSAAKRILTTAGEMYEKLKAESSTSKLTKSKNMDLMAAAAMAKLPNHLPPLPLIPRGIAKSLIAQLPFRIIDLDPLEVARQLTIMDCRAFSLIRPHELIGLEFSKKSSTAVQHVRGMTEATNEITSLICDCILKEIDIKKRAMLIRYFIRVGENLLLLKNYNSLMPIVGALNSSMIARLKKTWALLLPKFRETFDHLRKSTDHSRNYADYRNVLKSSAPPCLPFLGIYLTDLTFTDEGNAAFKEGDDSVKKHVNFAKYYRTVAIVQEIQKFQVPYNLIEVKQLQERLKLWMKTSNSHWDEDVFYEKSLLLEPRNKSQPALTTRAKAEEKNIINDNIPLDAQAYF